MKNLTIISVFCLLFITSCNRKDTREESAIVNNFNLKVITMEGPLVTLDVSHKNHQDFAYAEQTQLTDTQPKASDLRFVNGKCTMKVPKGTKLVFFEYVDDERGRSLKATAIVPYLPTLLKLD